MKYHKLLSIIVIFFLIITNIQGTIESQKSVSDEDDQIGEIWRCSVSPIINKIKRNPSSTTIIYDAETYLMFIVDGVYDTNLNKFRDMSVERNELLTAMTDVLKNLPWLNTLRKNSGEKGLDEMLLDKNRSGEGDRRIFPFMKDGKIYYDPLSTLQFSYLLSHLAKTIVDAKVNRQLSPTATENAFLNQAVPFLYKELVVPLYFKSEAWWYPGAGGSNRNGSFTNMQARIACKLNKGNKNTEEVSYYRAIFDQELFMFAIASDLMHIANVTSKTVPSWFPMIDQTKLKIIIDQCYDVMRGEPNRRRLVTRTEAPFVFDEGVWFQHPDFTYAGNDDPNHLVKTLVPDISWDSSHCLRWPYWIVSFRDAYQPRTEEYKYYDDFTTKLASQFCKILSYTEDGIPRINNYFSGANGQYRAYPPNKPGFAPFGLTASLKYGSWYILGKRSTGIHDFNIAMAKAVRNVTSQNIMKSSQQSDKLPTSIGVVYEENDKLGVPMGLGPIPGEYDSHLVDINSATNLSSDLLGATAASTTTYDSDSIFLLYIIMGEKMGYF